MAFASALEWNDLPCNDSNLRSKQRSWSQWKQIHSEVMNSWVLMQNIYILPEGVEPVSLNSDYLHCTVLGMSQGFLVEIRAVNKTKNKKQKKPSAKWKTRGKTKLSQQYTEAVIRSSLHTIMLYLAICLSSCPWRIPSLLHGQKNENNKLLKRSSRNTNITDGIGESTAKKQGAERMCRSIIL